MTKSVQEERAYFKSNAHLENNVPHWNSNNNVPPQEVLNNWVKAGIKFNMEKSKEVRSAQVSKSIAEYKRNQKNNKKSPQELDEMRNAFGSGTTVVNVITGEKTTF